MLVGCLAHMSDKVGNKFNASELNKFMKHVRSLVSITIEAKRLFWSFDSEGKDLAGYDAIYWWNNWVQQAQIFNMGTEKIYIVTLQKNVKYQTTSARLINLIEDKKSLARLAI